MASDAAQPGEGGRDRGTGSRDRLGVVGGGERRPERRQGGEDWRRDRVERGGDRGGREEHHESHASRTRRLGRLAVRSERLLRDVSWTCRGRVQSAARGERLLLESGEQGREELLQRRVGAEPPRAAAVATDGAEGARGVAANARVAERAEDGLHAPLQRLRPLGWGEPRRKSRDAAQSGGAQVRRSPIPYSTRRGEGSLDRRSERALLRSVGKRVRRLGGASRSCRRLAAVSAATVPAAPRIGRRSQVPAR